MQQILLFLNIIYTILLKNKENENPPPPTRLNPTILYSVFYLHDTNYSVMKIENIHISYVNDVTVITWDFEGIPCKFINNRRTEYDDIIDWINSMPREDQEEHFVTDVDYIGRTLRDEGKDPEYYSDMLND